MSLERRSGPIPVWTFVVCAIIAVAADAAAERSRQKIDRGYREQQLAAARTVAQAEQAILNAKRERGIPIESEYDFNSTGLIGPETSFITTDSGDLRAKRTSTVPDFAGATVEMMMEAGLRRGDTIAVGMTGSFPALNIAVYAAAQELGVRPIVISSVGSSYWGASDPEMTWLDMETILYDQGILRHRSVAASIGGEGDNGRNLKEGREVARQACERNQVLLIEKPTVEESIDQRMAIYQIQAGSAPIRAFVNVGGGVANVGKTTNKRLIPAGLTRHLSLSSRFTGAAVVARMARRDLPIINLLDVDELARRYDLPVDPGRLPKPGATGFFQRSQYSRIKVGVILGGLLICVLAFTQLQVAGAANRETAASGQQASGR